MGRPCRLNYDQVADLLRMVRDGVQGVDATRAFGITPSALNYWKRYARMDSEWLRHVRDTEHRALMLGKEVVRLRRQVALAADAITELLPTHTRRAVLARRLKDKHGLSHLRANQVVGLTSGAGIRAPYRGDEPTLLARMRAHLAKHPSCGFRRMFHLEFNDGSCSQHRLQQIYRENHLQAKRSGTRRRPKPVPANHIPKPHPIPEARDQIWSVDWMMISLQGKRHWILNVIDDFSRECVACRVVRRATVGVLTETLDGAMCNARKPVSIRSDNGGQFHSGWYTRWAWEHQIALRYIRPGHPIENVLVERLHQTVRNEAISPFSYKSAAALQRGLDSWRKYYNEVRPHSSLGDVAPLTFAHGR